MKFTFSSLVFSRLEAYLNNQVNLCLEEQTSHSCLVFFLIHFHLTYSTAWLCVKLEKVSNCPYNVVSCFLQKKKNSEQFLQIMHAFLKSLFPRKVHNSSYNIVCVFHEAPNVSPFKFSKYIW